MPVDVWPTTKVKLCKTFVLGSAWLSLLLMTVNIILNMMMVQEPISCWMIFHPRLNVNDVSKIHAFDTSVVCGWMLFMQLYFYLRFDALIRPDENFRRKAARYGFGVEGVLLLCGGVLLMQLATMLDSTFTAVDRAFFCK